MDQELDEEVGKLAERAAKAKASKTDDCDADDVLHESSKSFLVEWVLQKRSTLPTVHACHKRAKELDEKQWPDFQLPVPNPTFSARAGKRVASDGKIRADAFYFFGAIVIFLTFHEFWNLKPFVCTYCKKSCHMEHNGWGPTLRRVVGLDRVCDWLCSRNYRCRNCYNEELVSSYFCSFYQNCFFTILAFNFNRVRFPLFLRKRAPT